jgi:hypothetical protein
LGDALRLNVLGMRGDGGDAKSVFEGDGVLNQASGEGLLQSPQLALIEGGDDDFDLKVFEPEGSRGRAGIHAHEQPFGREAAELQVLGYVLADAAAQRDEEQLGRTHAVVGGSVFGGLIEQDFVLACFRRKAGAAGVLQSDFQKTLPGANTRKGARRVPFKISAKASFGCERGGSSGRSTA